LAAWLWNSEPVDLTAQADAYEAAYEAFLGRPWFAGMYWWNWPAALPTSGSTDDYPSYLKPAESVMTSWNAALAPPPSAPARAKRLHRRHRRHKHRRHRRPRLRISSTFSP